MVRDRGRRRCRCSGREGRGCRRASPGASLRSWLLTRQGPRLVCGRCCRRASPEPSLMVQLLTRLAAHGGGGRFCRRASPRPAKRSWLLTRHGREDVAAAGLCRGRVVRAGAGAVPMSPTTEVMHARMVLLPMPELFPPTLLCAGRWEVHGGDCYAK